MYSHVRLNYQHALSCKNLSRVLKADIPQTCIITTRDKTRQASNQIFDFNSNNSTKISTRIKKKGGGGVRTRPPPLVYTDTRIPDPPFFLIWSLPRLWYGSLSGSMSLNHLSIFYNISCYNSLVLLTFVSRSSCRFTYIYIKVRNNRQNTKRESSLRLDILQ